MSIFNFDGKEYEVTDILNRIAHKEIIQRHYDRIREGIIEKDSGMTIYTKTNPSIELSRGCQACKEGKWWCLFLGNNCNAQCKFCSQKKTHEELHRWEHPRSVARFWIDDVKFYLDKIGDKITGFSFSGGEPLMYIEKLEEISKYILESKPQIYRWMYTNGILLTEKKIRRLQEAGIQEIRIDLTATNFDDKVIKQIKTVKEIIGKVTVEIPSIPESFHKLVEEEYLKKIIDLGVEQLNLAELSLQQHVNWANYAQGEAVYIYDNYRGENYSPTYSRCLTIYTMEYAIQNKLNILINDCSNDAKHLQGLMREENAPKVAR